MSGFWEHNFEKKDAFERRYILKRLFAVCCGLMFGVVWMGVAHGLEEEAILGKWLTEEGKAEVEIYRCNDTYCGKIVWLKEPKNEDGKDKTDVNNPDPEKREQGIIGLDIVWGFKYDGDNKWDGGKIYDPDNGKTYSCNMTLESDGLKVRGYVGFSWLGRTTVWTRRQ